METHEFSPIDAKLVDEWKEETLDRKVQAKASLDATLREYKAAHRRDKHAQVLRIQLEAQAAAEKGHSKTLFACTKKLHPYAPRPCPQVLLEDGETLASDLISGRRRRHRFFQAQLSGKPTSLSRLSRESFSKQQK